MIKAICGKKILKLIIIAFKNKKMNIIYFKPLNLNKKVKI